MVCPTGVKQCAVSFRTAMQRYYANGGESKEESPSQVSFSFHSVYQVIAMAKRKYDGNFCRWGRLYGGGKNNGHSQG